MFVGHTGQIYPSGFLPALAVAPEPSLSRAAPPPGNPTASMNWRSTHLTGVRRHHHPQDDWSDALLRLST